MAARSFNAWRASMSGSVTESWSKGTVTVTTTGAYIITCQIKSGAGSLGREAIVDGDTVYCNEVWVVCAPDPIQPSTNPIQSIVGTEESSSVGGGPGINSKEPGGSLRAGMWIDNWYSGGGIISGAYETDYIFETIADFYTALDAGEIVPINAIVYFDVYINGNDQPNIFVNWTAGEDLSPITLKPRIWRWVYTGSSPIPPEIVQSEITGLNVPNSYMRWNIESPKDYSYGGSLSTSYIEIYNAFLQYLNPSNRVIYWGLDGIPPELGLFVQMNDGERYGDLFRIYIEKDGTPRAEKIADSSNTDAYSTIIRFHTGEPDYVMPDDPDTYPDGDNIDGDGPGRYDPDNRPNRNDFTDPVGFDGNAVLTKTYAVSAATLQNIGQKLWTQSYFDVLKIQSNPIENIVAVKHYPFSMSGASEEIQVGDVPFGINGDKVASVQKITIAGSYTYTGKFKGYLDLEPFTHIKLNLPYIGLIQLDPADLLGSKLQVVYYVDLVTGQCMAKLFLDEDATSQKSIPYMTLYGQMGIDIPLTSSDRVQTELRAASAAVTAIGGSVGQIISGNVAGGIISGLSDAMNIAGVDVTTQRTASQSPACTSFASPDIFILIERPCADTSQGVDDRGVVDPTIKNGYAHLHGFPCHKFKRLKDYPAGSFVQVERRTDIKIGMTAEENRMLEELLTTGIYI